MRSSWVIFCSTLAALVLAVGCPNEPREATTAPTAKPEPTATPAVDDAMSDPRLSDDDAPPPLAKPRDQKPSAKRDEPERQPEGVPFPLAEVAAPRAVRSEQLPNSGPEPIAFWVGGRGKQDGQFNYPRAVVVGHEGNAFIVDKTGRIQKWSPEGKLLSVGRTPAIEQGKPTGLGIDPAGNLLVADTHYCRVLVYSPDLTFLRAYGAPGKEPGNFMLITSVQAGEGGFHYVTDYGDMIARVQVFKDDGTHVRAWGTFGDGPSEFNRPMAIAVDDGRDRLYVADAVNHRISIFTREGKHVGALGGPGREVGQLNYPYDVEVDDEGQVWVAEFGGQRVTLYGADGGCVGVWGGPGREVPALNRPWGLALAPKGRLWVLDSACDRAYVLGRDVVRGGH